MTARARVWWTYCTYCRQKALRQTWQTTTAVSNICFLHFSRRSAHKLMPVSHALAAFLGCLRA